MRDAQGWGLTELGQWREMEGHPLLAEGFSSAGTNQAALGKETVIHSTESSQERKERQQTHAQSHYLVKAEYFFLSTKKHLGFWEFACATSLLQLLGAHGVVRDEPPVPTEMEPLETRVELRVP